MKIKHENPIIVGLIGNPNTGKTSLLNCLTGLNLHVGNWPGKTVEKKECSLHFQENCLHVVDLPGTYSIAPYSEEEKIARDFIKKQDSNVIVQTIDVNSLKRHLLMTLELLALGKTLILAFNFNKEAKRKQIKINIKKIEKQLKIPIVKIEANTGAGKKDLLKQIIISSQKTPQKPSYLKNLLKNKKEVNHFKAIKFIEEKISPFYSAKKQNGQTKKIDSLLLNKYTAMPFFILVMLILFKTTFGLSSPLIDLIDQIFAKLTLAAANLPLPPAAISFLTEGLLGGVGSIVSFTPLIFILFFLIALLEDSGYLARTVVLTDRLFHKFGVSGQVFIPLILGFGCNVPAIMAVRTIKNKKERQIAIFTNSFISCGARLPIYILFSKIFFPKNTTLVIGFLYLLGIIINLFFSLILAKILKSSKQGQLIIELPPYRLPTFRNVYKQAWFQTSMFLKKAGTIILITVMIIWFLASFPFGVKYGSEFSLLGKLGRLISPLFKPLGFGHFSFAVALVFGLVAKEVVVSTLGALYGLGANGLTAVLPNYLNPAGALAFLVFSLLYIPCLATIAVIKKETNSLKFTFIQILTTIITAWIISFIVYKTALLFS